MKKKVAVLLAMAMAAGVLSGCGGSGGKETTAAATEAADAKETTAAEKETEKETEKADEGERKQALSVSLDAEPDSLDLAKVSDMYSTTVVSQMIEGLTAIRVDENGAETVEPGMAESWESSEDQMTWTFHLRDAKWEDGVDVKAGDFEYAIKRILNPETASPISGNILFIKNAEEAVAGSVGIDEVGVKALDDKTLEIQLAYPAPYFLSSCAGSSMLPMRQDIVEANGDSYGTEADKIVGNGPFSLKEWVHNSKISYVKNPSYWNADAVKLEELTMKIINEETARIGEFENGGIDVVPVSTAEWVEKLDQNKDYVKKVVSLPRTVYLFFNQEVELFSNEKVRQAFSIALNREEIASEVYQGMQEPAYGWIPNSMQVDGVNFREMAGEPIQELIEENPDPKALLIEGLKELGMSEDPSQVTVQLMSRNTSQDIAEYFQYTFNTVLGVNVEIDPVEWPVFQERNRGLDYEMGFKSYGADFDDPYSMMQLWMTGVKTVPTGWSNEEYDRLMTEASQSLDKELRAKDYKEAEALVLRTATICPYAYSTDISYSKNYVKNIMEPVFSSTLYKYSYIE